MTVPLPSEGDTTWYDWATDIHSVADAAQDNFVQQISAPTGDAALLWYDTDATPTVGPISPANTVADLTNRPATTQAGTTYTLAASDTHTVVVCSNAAQVTVTIPLFASVPFEDGDRIVLYSSGAGGVTLSVTSITLLGSSPNLTVAQNQSLYLEAVDASADTWLVIGGTAA